MQSGRLAQTGSAEHARELEREPAEEPERDRNRGRAWERRKPSDRYRRCPALIEKWFDRVSGWRSFDRPEASLPSDSYLTT